MRVARFASTMANVSMVVERGLARCPRCVSMADYVFIETVSEHASPVTRYEVRCRKCGQCYGEESQPLSYPPLSVVVEPPIVWPRDHEPTPPRDWRQEVRERVDRAALVAKKAAGTADQLREQAGGLARTWAGGLKRAVEAKVAARRAGDREPGAPDDGRTRECASDDQTGG